NHAVSCGFEKELRTLRRIHAIVETAPTCVFALFHAGGAAAEIGHARGPNFLVPNRSQKRLGIKMRVGAVAEGHSRAVHQLRIANQLVPAIGRRHRNMAKLALMLDKHPFTSAIELHGGKGTQAILSRDSGCSTISMLSTEVSKWAGRNMRTTPRHQGRPAPIPRFSATLCSCLSLVHRTEGVISTDAIKCASITPIPSPYRRRVSIKLRTSLSCAARTCGRRSSSASVFVRSRKFPSASSATTR